MKKMILTKKRLTVLFSLLLSFSVTLSVFFYLWRWEDESTQALSGDKDGITVLLAGVDEEGYHTDMMMLCHVSPKAETVKMIQIPRDTYYRTPNGEGKINRIYSGYASKYGTKDAADKFCGAMSDAFGISLDGYVVFDTHVVSDLVDLLGGVRVTLPTDVPYYSEQTGKNAVIPAGERSLTGEQAAAFVRHRKSYAEGDLGRLDAQMRFLSGMCEALPKLKKFDQYLGIYQKILPNLLTNLGEKDIINLLMAYWKRAGEPALSMMRLPGEPLCYDGVWYYLLHRDATERMLSEQLALAGYRFDAQKRFTCEEKTALRNAYNDPDTRYRVLTPKEAAAIKITQR